MTQSSNKEMTHASALSPQSMAHQPLAPPSTAASHAGPAPTPLSHLDALPTIGSPIAAATSALPPLSGQQVGPAGVAQAPLTGRASRQLPLDDQLAGGAAAARLVHNFHGPQSPVILLSPPVPRSFTPVPACVAGGDVFAPSAFELLPPPARRTSRLGCARSFSASDVRSAAEAEVEEGREWQRRGGGASFDVGRLEAALLGREMEQSFKASGRRIMAEGVTTIASVRGGSLVRSTFSARPAPGEAAAAQVASRKLSVPDPPPPSAPPLARPASCHQLSSIAAGAGVASGAAPFVGVAVAKVQRRDSFDPTPKGARLVVAPPPPCLAWLGLHCRPPYCTWWIFQSSPVTFPYGSRVRTVD